VEVLDLQKELLPHEREMLGDLVAVISEHAEEAVDPVDMSKVTDAFVFACERHADQRRKSGEQFITHPTGVAKICAGMRLDTETICAALLHDTVEDTSACLDDVTARFGEDICQLVDGVTKLSGIRFQSRDEHQAENYRKMMVAMASDIRVILIKLADRLHNMRTLGALPKQKQIDKAKETLDIYAPLAHRLGIHSIKWELEDLAFSTLHPRKHSEIKVLVNQQRQERDRYVERAGGYLKQELEAVGIDASVSGRAKHFYSIYSKMTKKGREFNEIYDLTAMRVIVDSVKDCYGAIGVIHSLWKPLPGRFKDYIAMPRFNLYQALHTTVIGPEGRPLEIQIRTRQMHYTAEYGVAAHWIYKGGKRASRSGAKDGAKASRREHTGAAVKEADLVPDGEASASMPSGTADGGAAADVAKPAWLRHLLDWQQELHDPKEFMETLKIDLFEDEVFVFTPKGEVKSLPAGATPLDFAYAVHTDVGHRCVGAKVNGKIAPLHYRLQSGEIVEILTSKQERGPSRDWLALVTTSRARNKIRAWFTRERREDAEHRGRELLQETLRKQGLPASKITGSALLADVIREMGFRKADDFYVALGQAKISSTVVANKLLQRLKQGDAVADEGPAEGLTRGKPDKARPLGTALGYGIKVEGIGDVMVRLAKCCRPVPGDEIVGYISLGRGITIHRDSCKNAQALKKDPERFTKVSWEGENETSFRVELQVDAWDRTRLLEDLSRTFAEAGVNIVEARCTVSHPMVKNRFVVEVGDTVSLKNCVTRLRNIDSVFDAYRVAPGG
jgi:guanosine-3',5'-bis(diphosphate) 3'-pyrophosphohydrolase